MIQSRVSRDWIINSNPFGNATQTLQGALTWGEVCSATGHRLFIWRVPPRQIKELFLCALSASVVKNLFWTRVAKNIITLPGVCKLRENGPAQFFYNIKGLAKIPLALALSDQLPFLIDPLLPLCYKNLGI